MRERLSGRNFVVGEHRSLEDLKALEKSARQVSTGFKYLSNIFLITSGVRIALGVIDRDSSLTKRGLLDLGKAAGCKLLQSCHSQMANDAADDIANGYHFNIEVDINPIV